MIVYLGTHLIRWLAESTVPLFLSYRRLGSYKKLPVALTSWALDSGGHTEIALFGKWETPAPAYAASVRRYATEIGNLQWAAIQDWNCRPALLQKSGLSVKRHQELTVDSYEELLALDPSLPWVPVLQGWEPSDYLRHLDLYQARGHDLTKLSTVGVGTIAGRQDTAVVSAILSGLHLRGVQIHAFGLKTKGLMRNQHFLVSSDSMAWSFHARMEAPWAACPVAHKSCSNCMPFAFHWYRGLLKRLQTHAVPQLLLSL